MSIVRYSDELNDFIPTGFSRLVDRFFNDSVARSGGSVYSFVPKVDVIENDKGFEIQLAVPGMEKEDFKINLNENKLTISGERKLTKESDGKHFRSVETQYGAFGRTFVLPENVDGGKIEAKYDKGILEIYVPKDEKKLLKTAIKVA